MPICMKQPVLCTVYLLIQFTVNGMQTFFLCYVSPESKIITLLKIYCVIPFSSCARPPPPDMQRKTFCSVLCDFLYCISFCLLNFAAPFFCHFSAIVVWRFRSIIEPICQSKSLSIEAVGVYLDADRATALPLDYDIYALAGHQIHVIGEIVSAATLLLSLL